MTKGDGQTSGAAMIGRMFGNEQAGASIGNLMGIFQGGGSGKGEGNQAGKQGEFHGITVANGRVMQRQKRKPEITRSHFRRVESDRRSRLRCECSSSHSRRQPV